MSSYVSLQRTIKQLLDNVTHNKMDTFGSISMPFDGFAKDKKLGMNLNTSFIGNQTDLSHQLYRLHPIQASIRPAAGYFQTLLQPDDCVYCLETYQFEICSSSHSTIGYKSILVFNGSGIILKYLHKIGRKWAVAIILPESLILELLLLVNNALEKLSTITANGIQHLHSHNSMEVGMACFVESLGTEYPLFYPSHVLLDLQKEDQLIGLAMEFKGKLFPYYYSFMDNIYYSIYHSRPDIILVPLNPRSPGAKLMDYSNTIDNQTHRKNDPRELSTDAKRRK